MTMYDDFHNPLTIRTRYSDSLLAVIAWLLTILPLTMGP